MSEMGGALFLIFVAIAWIMTAYTLNFHYLSFRSIRNKYHEKIRIQNRKANANIHFPIVTIQHPIYNEKYVAQRLIEAVCKMDYPREKLEIQVLDDSDDETSKLVELVVQRFRREDVDISILRRENRTGFKAGALQNG